MYRIYSIVIGEFVKRPQKGNQKGKKRAIIRTVILIHLVRGGRHCIKMLKSTPGQNDLDQAIYIHGGELGVSSTLT